MKISIIDWVAMVLVIVGGLNWGLVSLGFNLVEYLFGSWSWLVTTVYALVGVSALWMVVVVLKMRKSNPVV